MRNGIRIEAMLLWLLLMVTALAGSLVYADVMANERWSWRNLTPAEGPAPEPRRFGTAIYDPMGQRVLVFGGLGASDFLNDVWAFDLASQSWMPIATVGTPPAPRFGHNAVYDPIGYQMVIWAGQQGSRFYNDTWVLNLETYEWRDASPEARPTARYGATSVFDPVERRLVTFAGFTSEGSRYQDTQAFPFDTEIWEDLTPPGDKPQVRCLLTGAFEPASRRMIIYGGQRNGPLDDLWAFDLNERLWTELTPAERPAGRFFATSFIDAAGRFIVFGGLTAAGDVNETWAFDFEAGQWSRLEIEGPPSARNGMMGAYVAEEDRFLVFGGTATDLLNEIWELRKP